MTLREEDRVSEVLRGSLFAMSPTKGPWPLSWGPNPPAASPPALASVPTYHLKRNLEREGEVSIFDETQMKWGLLNY